MQTTGLKRDTIDKFYTKQNVAQNCSNIAQQLLNIDNEYFIPAGYGWSSIILSVFDRWGTQVFKSHDDVRGWDGKYGGKLCEQGVYVYKVDVITMGGKEFVRTGHVTLLSKIK